MDSLVKTNERQARQLEEMSVRIKELTAQIAWFQPQMFRRRSEKRMAPDTQLSLFDDIEESATANEEAQEETPVENSAEKTVVDRRKPKPRENWENLPVLKTIVHEPGQVDFERYRKIGE